MDCEFTSSFRGGFTYPILINFKYAQIFFPNTLSLALLRCKLDLFKCTQFIFELSMKCTFLLKWHYHENFFFIIQKYNACLIFLPNFKAKFVHLPDFFTILICQF